MSAVVTKGLMFSQTLLSRMIRNFGAIILGLFAISSLHAQSSTAPTASQDPVAIDQAWQKGSSKYDSQRAAVLEQVDKVDQQGPFRPDWESLQKYEVPEWYKDAKFGIFIHWGVYSVPAFGNEWYPRNMYVPGSPEYQHHIATYGTQDKFGYKDFIPMFKAEHFDAAAWADLFKKAGAKYVVPVAEHHDGFAMYDSGLSDWTAAKMGPHRDVIGQLAKAVRADGSAFWCVVPPCGTQFLPWGRPSDSVGCERSAIRCLLRPRAQLVVQQVGNAPRWRFHLCLLSLGK